MTAEQTNICSKSAMETLEIGMKLFKAVNKDTRTTSILSHLFFSVSVVDFEHVNVYRVFKGERKKF